MVFAKTTLIKEYPMCHYQHLTLIEREKIMFFRAQGKNLSAIANDRQTDVDSAAKAYMTGL